MSSRLYLVRNCVCTRINRSSRGWGTGSSTDEPSADGDSGRLNALNAIPDIRAVGHNTISDTRDTGLSLVIQERIPSHFRPEAEQPLLREITEWFGY